MSDKADFYCATGTSICRAMSEWAVYWQALTAIFTIVAGAVGLYKIYCELKRLNEQREKDNYDKENSSRLKRVDFFINQHRRLFDNEDLYSVLCLIDDDNILLAAGNGMADKKRKFLTYLEEISLLVESRQIEKDVAHYMFGYYALCALKGKNFASGIDTSKKYWGLLYKFAAESRDFFEANPNGPPEGMAL